MNIQSNTLTRIEQRLFFSLLLLLFWIPIPLGSNRPWAWAILELWSFGMFVLWIGSGLARQHLPRLRLYKPLILSFLIIQIWVFIQLLPLPTQAIQLLQFGSTDLYPQSSHFHSISLDSAQTKISLLKGLAYSMLLILVLSLVSNSTRLKQMLFCFISAGSVQAIYGAFMLLSGTKFSWVLGLPQEDRATGTFVYHNFFGNFLVLCLCVGIGLLIAKLSKNSPKSLRARARALLSMLLGGKAVLRVCLAIMVIGLVMSHSRMGNVAFFASLSIMGGLAFILIKNRSRSLTILLISLLVIDVFIVGSVFGLQKVQERLEDTSFQKEHRDEIIKDSFTLIKTAPFTGTGAGSFYSSFPSVKTTRVSAFYDHAHNDYVELASDLGIPALILLISISIWSFFQAISAIKNRRDALMRGVGFGSAMAIIAMGISLLTDFHLHSPANAVYFLVCLALAWISRIDRYKTIKAP